MTDTPCWITPTALVDGIAMIHPSCGAQFSPGLYLWMKRQVPALRRVVSRLPEPDGRHLRRLALYVAPRTSALCQAYGARPGSLFLGLQPHGHRGDFLGSAFDGFQMSEYTPVVRRAAGATGLLEVSDFWPNYLAVGRCAIDLHHEDDSNGSRFVLDGHHRRCVWCGTRHVWAQWPRHDADSAPDQDGYWTPELHQGPCR